MHDARTALSKEVADRGARLLRPQGLRDHDPAQRAGGRGAVRTASRSCSTTTTAPAARPTSSSPPRSSSASAGSGRLDRHRSARPSHQMSDILKNWGAPMPIPMQKGRLGRGLASLIGETPQAEPRLPAHGEQRLLSIDQLHPSGLNPRKIFGDIELIELAEFDPPQGPAAADHRPARPRARRLRDRRRRAPLAGGAEGRPAHRAGHRPRAQRPGGRRVRPDRERAAHGPQPDRGGDRLQRADREASATPRSRWPR